MQLIKRAAFYAVAMAATTYLPNQTATAACNATVNARPMTPLECATAIQVYGQVVPGNYVADDYGNWVNANNPTHRGNTYTDGRRSYGGSWGGGSYVSPRGVYDGSGGCEGGSCVNIID